VESKGGGAAFLDVDNDGIFDDDENIIIDILGITWDRGRESELDNTPGSTLEMEVDDPNGDYSPENASSRFGSGNVTPGRAFRYTVELDGIVYEQWRGFVEKITPHPDPETLTATILCVDGFDRLARDEHRIPRDALTPFAESPFKNILGGERGVTQVSGVNMTFADANPDTITRASGSFITDGYQAGMTINVTGAINLLNNGNFVILSLIATVITVDNSAALFAEGPTVGVVIKVVGIIPTILDEAAWPVLKRVIDPGVDNFDLWWTFKESALTSLYAIETAEKSFLYVDEEGRFVYEDRHHRQRGVTNPHGTSVATFTDDMVTFDYSLSSRSVRNIAIVRGHKRTEKAVAQVYGTKGRPKIGVGVTTTIWADLSQPAAEISISDDGSDWKANTEPDGSGADHTADVALVVTHYGQSVKLEFTNQTIGTPFFLVPGTSDPDDTLFITGKEFEDDPIVATVIDQSSIDDHGRRSISIDTQFKGDFNAINAYAEWLVARFKDPQPDFVKMTLLGTDNTLTKLILSLKISDRVTITAAQLGITSKDYFIDRLERETEPGGFESVVYSLQSISASGIDTNSWILGVAGFSELGQTTSLGF